MGNNMSRNNNNEEKTTTKSTHYAHSISREIFFLLISLPHFIHHFMHAYTVIDAIMNY